MTLKEAEHKKDVETKIRHEQYWRDAIGNKLIGSLTSDDIQAYLLTQVNRTRKQLSPAIQNRYRSSIMRALNLAKQAGWSDSVPYIQKIMRQKIGFGG